MSDRPIRATFAHRTATLAVLGIEPSSLAALKSAWLKFGIEVRPVAFEGIRSLKEQRVTAFIARLDAGVKPLLHTIRAMDEFQNSLIYAVGDDADIAGMAELEISVLMPDLSEDSAVEAIQNTYQLLMHQMRRYARIPMVIPVKVTTGAFTITAVSRNISAGGIRLSLVEPAEAQFMALRPDTVSQITFEAPHASRFHLPSTMVRKEKNSVGFEFMGSPDKEELRHWLDKRLQR
jgi:hypothetical protein